MPMGKRYCFLCVSDEGVFLDITEENRAAISQQLETCSLHPEQLESTDETIKQICHKCAYELMQCSSFIDKCKKTLNAKKKSRFSNKTCCLCLETRNKLHLFNLQEDNYSSETLIYKIRNIFNHNISEDKNQLICLSCRYTLDVLYDLNKIYQENLPRLQNIKNEEVNYSLFPKTRTRVVNRKTTTTESNFISSISISDSDSESSIMPRKKESRTNIRNRKSLPKSDLQSCTECKNTYSSSRDVYKIHKTGNTVCKKCWLTMDPSGHDDIKTSADTKVCSVFVKDVLRDSTYKKDHVYKIEEDSDGHKTYIITEPQNKEKTKPPQNKAKSDGNKASTITEAQNKEKTKSPQNKSKNDGDKASTVTEAQNKEKTKSPQNKPKNDGNKASIITEAQNKAEIQFPPRVTRSNGNKASNVTELKNNEKVQLPQRVEKRTASLDESDKPQKRSKAYATRGSKTSAESTDSDEKTTKKQLKVSKNGNISKVSNEEEEPVTMRRTRHQAKIEENANLKNTRQNQKNQNQLVKESPRKAASDTEQVTSRRKSGRNRKRTIASKTDASEESSSEGVLSKKRKLISKTETNGDDVQKTQGGDSSSSDIEIISVTDASDETNDAELKSAEVPEAAINDEVSKSRREKRSQTSEPPVETANEKGKSKTSSKKDGKGKRARSTSASSNEVSQPAVGRKKQRENTPPSQEPVTLDITEPTNSDEATVIEEDKPYYCKICDKSFDTKILGLTHELSHHKQLEVKLHRRKLEEESETKDDADDNEARAELEETSENIAIRLDDDEDNDVDTLGKPEKEDTDVDAVSKPEKEETDVDAVSKPEKEETDVDAVSKPEKEETDVDAVSKPEKEDTEHSDEVKEAASPKKDSPSESPKDTEIEEDSSKHDTSSQKADVVESPHVDTDKDRTPIVLDESLKKNLDCDVKDDSDKSNSNATEQKDNNEKVELPKEPTEKSDDSTEKEEQVDSTEADKLTKIDVEPSETDAVDKNVSIVEASDDAPAEALADDIKENGNIGTEKVKEDEVEQKELNSTMDTSTKDSNNSQANKEEESKDVSLKTIETTTDETPDATQEPVKENSLEKEVSVSEKKDDCQTVVSAAVDSPLRDLEGSRTGDTETDTRENQSENAATAVLQEVFDLAAAEVQKRHDSSPKLQTENQEDVETVENISREIQNSVDLKPLNSNKNNDAVGNEVSLD